MDHSVESWSAPTKCRICRSPVASHSDLCLHCGTPQALFSQATLSYLLRGSSTFVRGALEATLFCASILGVLYVCYKVSLLVVLIPVFLACSSVTSD
ncbi:MAG TPA: hypothetical protein EYO33_26475 [Phycisphaerales bacterium]|nr:hypothetical protein [Phycisphaerales bacterium]